MIVLIDNYDSFTYNLYQLMGEYRPDISVIRNDLTDVDGLRTMKPDRIVLSPGPKTPDEAGICMEAVKAFVGVIPILGICLGHQCIGRAHGGTVSNAKRLMHGKQSDVLHMGDPLFDGVPDTFKAARYHSLTLMEDGFPDSLQILARAGDDGEIMAVRHRKHPVYGLQFHPESIYTEHGKRILKNFLAIG